MSPISQRLIDFHDSLIAAEKRRTRGFSDRLDKERAIREREAIAGVIASAEARRKAKAKITAKARAKYRAKRLAEGKPVKAHPTKIENALYSSHKIYRVKLEKLVDIPLVLGDDGVVREDKTSWAWMACRLGVITLPKRAEMTASACSEIVTYIDTDFTTRFEQRYTYHRPERALPAARSYWDCNIDPYDYNDTAANRHHYSPLNFHDEPMWMYNS